MMLADAVPQAEAAPQPEFMEFLFVWVLLGLSSFLFFHLNRNAALKRRVLPAFAIAAGAIFGGFVYLSVGRQEPQVLYIMIPALILITFLNVRTTRFCDFCGRTLYRQPIFSQTQFCPHCGAELKDNSLKDQGES